MEVVCLSGSPQIRVWINSTNLSPSLNPAVKSMAFWGLHSYIRTTRQNHLSYFFRAVIHSISLSESGVVLPFASIKISHCADRGSELSLPSRKSSTNLPCSFFRYFRMLFHFLFSHTAKYTNDNMAETFLFVLRFEKSKFSNTSASSFCTAGCDFTCEESMSDLVVDPCVPIGYSSCNTSISAFIFLCFRNFSKLVLMP